MENWKQWLLPLLTEDMQQALLPVPEGEVTEIRLRLNRPMEVVWAHRSRLLYAPNGRAMLREGQQEQLLNRFCRQAPYAWEQQLQNGFVTLSNGCRVGVTGRIHPQTGLFAPITGFCIRMARPVKGCGAGVLPLLLREGSFASTLIFSPPGRGKTTLLRDLVRLLSTGESGARPHRVGVVDERFEIGGEGIAMDLGERTDILAGMGKREGLLRLLATMAPEVLAADELQLQPDIEAVLEAKSRGVEVLCTAHGGNLRDLLRREGMMRLFREQTFHRYVALTGCGQVEHIYNEKGEPI